MIVAFFAILGGALLLSIIFKERLEYTIPTFLLLTIVILYISGLVFNLTVGFILLIIISLFGIGWTIYQLLCKKTRENAFGLLFSTPLIIFTILCGFIFVVNINRQFQAWDDFSHWGVMLRETLRLNDFHNQVGSALIVHRNYPPAVTLFQYYFSRLAGGFSEQDAFRALQLLTLSLMLPAFTRAKCKVVLGCAFIVMLFLPDALGISTYANIYTDTILGVLLGYALFLIIAKMSMSVFYFLNLFLVSITMVLTKQMGLFLVLFPIALVLLIFIHERFVKKRAEECNQRESLFQILSIGIILLGAISGQLTWAARLNYVNVSGGQFSIVDILRNTVELLRGNRSTHHLIVMQNYVEAFFTRPIITFFNFTFFAVFIFLTCVTILLYIHSGKNGEKNRLLPFAILTPLGIAMYAVLMMLLYMVGFSEFEGVALASYNRYMSTIVIGFGVAFFLVFMNQPIKIDSDRTISVKKAILFMGIFFTLAISGETYQQVLVTGLVPRGSLEQEFKAQHAILFDTVDLEEDRVYLIMQGSIGFDFWRTRFYANPLQTNANFTWSIGSRAFEGDIWTSEINYEEWSEILLNHGFDYVYLVEVNDNFKEEFGGLFYNQEDIQNNVLMRVTEKDGTVMLVR